MRLRVLALFFLTVSAAFQLFGAPETLKATLTDYTPAQFERASAIQGSGGASSCSQVASMGFAAARTATATLEEGAAELAFSPDSSLAIQDCALTCTGWRTFGVQCIADSECYCYPPGSVVRCRDCQLCA
jgi:hypothetical protein